MRLKKSMPARGRLGSEPARVRLSGTGSLGLLLALLVVACSSTPPGPPFRAAQPPPEHRARLYLYRADDQHSFAAVRLTLDGRDVGELRNGEYETIEIAAGTHHLRAGLRGFGLLAWGWNKHRFRVAPGETIYRRISVRLMARDAPATRELEIGGRAGGAASENVFVVPETAQKALADLSSTTRLPAASAGSQ